MFLSAEAAILEDYEAAHALEEQAVAELLQSWQEGVLLSSPTLHEHFD